MLAGSSRSAAVRGLKSGDLVHLELDTGSTRSSTAASSSSTSSASSSSCWLQVVGEEGCAVLVKSGEKEGFAEGCRPVQVGFVDRVWQVVSEQDVLAGDEARMAMGIAARAHPFVVYGEVA